MKKSDGQGSYLAFNFKFSDLTIKTLTKQIELAEQKEEDEIENELDQNDTTQEDNNA